MKFNIKIDTLIVGLVVFVASAVASGNITDLKTLASVAGVAVGRYVASVVLPAVINAYVAGKGSSSDASNQPDNESKVNE